MTMVRNLLPPNPAPPFPKGKEDGLPPEMPEIPENPDLPKRQPPDADDER